MLALAVTALGACVAAPRAEPRGPVYIPPATSVPKPRATSQPRSAPRPSIPTQSTGAPAALVQGLQALWASYPDRVGIAVIRADGSWVIQHRGDEPMPQQSVSKLWVAITVMQAVDDGRLSLSDPVTLRKSDLTVFSAPAAALIGDNGYSTTVGGLLERAMTVSDNTANDILLRRVGGPAAVRAMISTKGLGAIRFGPGEHLLQAGTAGLPWKEEYRQGRAFQNARALLPDDVRRKAMDAYVANPPDGATPIAIARALIRLNRGELLSAPSTRTLLGLMAESKTGRARLRGGLPPDWTIRHKTGTGQDLDGRTAGYNDVAIITAPDGVSYAVVVQMADTSRPVPERQQLMQAVSALIVANHQR